MIAVVLDGMDLTDAQWAVIEPRVGLAVARTARPAVDQSARCNCALRQ
jgi:hypothetical protein